MVLKNRVHRLSESTNVLLQALYECWPTRHATYEDVLSEVLRFYLSHQRGLTKEVRDWLAANGYPELASQDFARSSRYDLPPEQREPRQSPDH